MKRTRIAKAAAVLMTLTLVAIALGVPNMALAAADDVTIAYSGSDTTLAVGETMDLTGTMEGATNVTYSWTITSGSSVTLPSTTDTQTITITAASVGATTIQLSATNTDNSVTNPATINIDVAAFSVTEDSVTIMPGNTATLTPNNYTGTITWGTGSSSVATVSDGVVTAVAGGTTTITASYTAGGVTQTDTTTVYVPIVTLTAANSTITAANTPTTLTLTVQYGGDIFPAGSAVAWSATGSVGSLTSYATTLSSSGADTSTCLATFTSGASGTNGSSTITAAITGSGYNTSKSTTVTVQTDRYLTIEGPSSLDKTIRTGIYTVYLHEADGTIVNDSTSTVHWSWSKSYLSITSNDLNDRRADMHGGEAHIELYARYNTPSSGTRLYAWINDGYDERVYHTITITGLSSLPQTGQDFTLPYVFAGLGGALLIATGVWYGIRKKRSEKA